MSSHGSVLTQPWYGFLTRPWPGFRQVIHDLAMIRDAPSLGARAVARKVPGPGTDGMGAAMVLYGGYQGVAEFIWIYGDPQVTMSTMG